MAYIPICPAEDCQEGCITGRPDLFNCCKQCEHVKTCPQPCSKVKEEE